MATDVDPSLTSMNTFLTQLDALLPWMNTFLTGVHYTQCITGRDRCIADRRPQKVASGKVV